MQSIGITFVLALVIAVSSLFYESYLRSKEPPQQAVVFCVLMAEKTAVLQFPIAETDCKGANLYQFKVTRVR